MMSLFDHHRKRAEMPRPGKWDFDFIEGKGEAAIIGFAICYCNVDARQAMAWSFFCMASQV